MNKSKYNQALELAGLYTPRKNAQATISGTYIRTKMQDFKNGFAIFEIRTGESQLTCSGRILPPHPDASVIVNGSWYRHDTYGWQLKNCTLRETFTTPESVFDYLVKIPGIGDETALAIATKCDIDILSLSRSEDAVHLLMRDAGISRQRAELVCDYVLKHEVHASLFMLLSGFQTGYATCERVYAKYGEEAVSAMFDDPYMVGIKYGLSFSECERLAIKFNQAALDDPRRVYACAVDELSRYSRRGDCCVEQAELAARVRKRIGDTDYGRSLQQKKAGNTKTPTRGGISTIMALDFMLNEGDAIIQEGKMLYNRPLYWQEVRAAVGIRRIVRSGIRTKCDPDALCDYAETVCGVTYAEQQREAFRVLQTGGLYILTGGPGTGKTTVVKGLLAAYEKLYPNSEVRLCAPTGRASQRMKEATGREACTVHRLLEYRPFGDAFTCKSETNPIEADFIVIDESSMISIDMAELLFNAIRPGTTVLLVGDTAQLPSVGPGNVLADIIRSGIAPVTALTRTYRQGAGSPIIENAYRVGNGISELLSCPDFQILDCPVEELIPTIRGQYMLYNNPEDPFSVQILTTTRRDETCGCNAISRIIQAQVNPRTSGGMRYGDTTYYVGDKIMMTQNNYNLGYFNGDIGTITAIAKGEVVVDINEETIRVPRNLLCDMSLAYATTIHKSQGSEYDVVIVVIPAKPASMLQRNILYTAITRARKRVILIASDSTIFACVNTISSVQRVTSLCERLNEKDKAKPAITQNTNGKEASLCTKVKQKILLHLRGS